jgi:hypothetical protein
VNITADGRVGLGVVAPQQALEVAGNMVVNGNVGIAGNINFNGTRSILTNGSYLLINKTNAGSAEYYKGIFIDSNGRSIFVQQNIEASRFCRNDSDGYVIIFQRGTEGLSSSIVGSINVTTSTTSYSTTSDYRLKENIKPMENAASKVLQLLPKTFNFKVDSNTLYDGFIAHEVQTIAPYAITGSKNEIDNNGEPIYQNIDHSKLVPLLTGALQEALRRIENLETDNTAIKARLYQLESTS